MNPGRYDLTIYAGMDWNLPLRLQTASGALLDTTGYTASLKIRQTYTSPTALLTATSAGGQIAVGWTPGKWAASTAYALNTLLIPNATGPNGFIYQVTTAGTTGASEPVWPTTIGGTVANGSVTFTCYSTDATLSDCYISVPAATTLALVDWGLGYYTLDLTDTFGHVQRVLHGTAVLSATADY